MSTPDHPVEKLVEGELYTMADLRRIDPTGGLATQARKQINDLSGLVARAQAASRRPDVWLEDPAKGVPAAKQPRSGLGLLGDRLPPDDTVQWR